MERYEAVIAWKRLQFLKDVKGVQQKHLSFLRGSDQNLMAAGLRVADLQTFLTETKRIFSNPWKQSFKDKNREAIKAEIEFVMELGNRTRLKVSVGGRPSGRKGPAVHIITVGYMWHYKVYRPFYQFIKPAFGQYLILSSNGIRVNSKLMNLYEVQAYHIATGLVTGGYVAQAKTERKFTAFGKTASSAISSAERMMSADIDKNLLGLD